MDNGGRIAAAVVGGYLLGRTKKMKFAIMMGGALMGKKVPTDPTQLLKLAGSLVEKSPELQRLDAAVRGRLMEAGKDAAMSVASNRMDALTDSLIHRVENLGKPAAEPDQPAEDTVIDVEDVEDSDGGADTDDADDQVPSPRNGSRSRNGAAARNGSGSPQSSRRSPRRMEAAHD